ncbi:hypothetical protein CDV36_004435 [Fusarium kuroshium]|uniref:Uncharacterized protein n=1 Tax=Fusarium kuroshium TaxID=2010991 RepID=A0A3M2SFI7_9HYPO|nr:hypothetical protein CDV36_004435 [Fusarium kuroshium]
MLSVFDSALRNSSYILDHDCIAEKHNPGEPRVSPSGGRSGGRARGGFGRGLPGTRQEAEEKISYWRQEGEMKYHESKFKEACEEVAKWTMRRDSLPEIPEAKAELDKEVEKKVAEILARKTIGEASQPPKTSKSP